MLALVTNDDGIESRGLVELALAATDAGLDIMVAAPSWDSSGASASLTSVEQGGRLLFSEVTLEGVAGRCLSVEAAPAFIIRAALHGSFGDPPDVVLSGVNHGLNCGHSILHSGTVGAATTAFTYGTPGLAFSIDTGAPMHWDTARAVAGAVLDWYCEVEPHVLLNVNVPNVAPDEVRGPRPALLAPFGAVTANVTETGEGYVTMEYRALEADADPDTDVALVEEGFATYTALEPVCESHTADLSSLDGLVLARSP